MATATISVNILGNNKLTPVLQQVAGGVSNLDKSLQGAGKRVTAFGDGLASAGGKLMAFGTAPILALGGASLKAATDMEATEAKFSTVFAGMEEQAMGFIREFKKLTPATTAEARSMASTIQDLLIPMGIARDEATNMTGEFLHVAGALQAFNSGTHDTQRVMEAMNAALVGSFEPLRSLGVQLDVNTVKQRALEMGLVDSTDEVDKAVQAQVVLSEIYAQSGDALDAYKEENIDTKTEIQLLRAEVTDIMADLGKDFIPIMRDVIGTARVWTDQFKALDDETKKNIITFAGVVAAIGPVLFIGGKLIVILGSIASFTGGVIGVMKFLGFNVLLPLGKIIFPLVLTAGKALLGVIVGFSAPVWVVIAALTALAGVAFLIWKNWDWVKEKLGQAGGAIFNAIKWPFEQGINWVKDQLASFNPGQMILNSINGIGGSVRRGLGNLFGGGKNVPAFATGGDFVTRGPQLIMVGDNPGGRERVQVTPLSSRNTHGPQTQPSTRGSVNITNHYHVQDRTDAEYEARRMANLIEQRS